MESDQSLLRVAPLARSTILGGRDGPNDSGKPHPSNLTRTGSNILTLRLPDVARELENYFATAVLAERRPAGPISSTRLLVGAEGLEPPTFAL